MPTRSALCARLSRSVWARSSRSGRATFAALYTSTWITTTLSEIIRDLGIAWFDRTPAHLDPTDRSNVASGSVDFCGTTIERRKARRSFGILRDLETSSVAEAQVTPALAGTRATE